MARKQSSNPVVIVGASVAGCAAAILFARRGIPVTVVEKRRSADFHKPICTHYIQPCSLPAWHELGMYEALAEAGAVRNTIAISTRWGWIPQAPLGDTHAFNLRRLSLDPLLRARMLDTPGITYIDGHSLSALKHDGDGAVTGARFESASGGALELPCSLLVGADGRESTLAEVAELTTREWPNARFSCFAFFRHIPNESRTVSRMWMLDPYIAYQFPNDDGTTLIALMPTKDRVGDFKADRDTHFREIVRGLPDGPDIDSAERISEYRMNTKNSMLLRERPPSGVAMVGDALMTTDPLHGFGISWGVLSASDLVAHVAPSLLAGDPTDAAVAAFERARRREVWPHFKIMAEMARAEPMPRVQQLLFSAATRDDAMAGIVQRFLAGTTGTRELLSLGTLMRALSVTLRHTFGRPRPAEPVTAES